MGDTYCHVSPSMPGKLGEMFLCPVGVRREGQLLLSLDLCLVQEIGMQSFGGGPELRVLGMLCSLERRTDFPAAWFFGSSLLVFRV